MQSPPPSSDPDHPSPRIKAEYPPGPHDVKVQLPATSPSTSPPPRQKGPSSTTISHEEYDSLLERYEKQISETESFRLKYKQCDTFIRRMFQDLERQKQLNAMSGAEGAAKGSIGDAKLFEYRRAYKELCESLDEKKS